MWKFIRDDGLLLLSYCNGSGPVSTGTLCFKPLRARAAFTPDPGSGFIRLHPVKGCQLRTKLACRNALRHNLRPNTAERIRRQLQERSSRHTAIIRADEGNGLFLPSPRFGFQRTRRHDGQEVICRDRGLGSL